jgi:WD40 repeat protein
MSESKKWDWDTSEELIATPSEWKTKFARVQEPYVSPDGKKIAAIVRNEDGTYTACVNGEAWENTYDNMWNLRFGPDGRLTAIVSEAGEWTLAVDGVPWENKFAYVWDTKFTEDGQIIAVKIQQDMKYGVAVNDQPWENLFEHIGKYVMTPDGQHVAAAVQAVPLGQAEVFKFKEEGTWTVAVDGNAWDKIFTNVWGLDISPDGKHVAAEVRMGLYDYTIAMDGEIWAEKFNCVWEPIFRPKTSDALAIAPVRAAGKWTLVVNGKPVWDSKFVQCWHQQYSPDGRKLAAIVAPSFAQWTVAIDGKPWATTFNELVQDLTFSPDGNRVAAIAKDDGHWKMVADGTPWPAVYDMVWPPIFSPDGHRVAAKVEKGGKYTIALDGKPWRECEAIWGPVFSLDGKKVLVRSIEDGKYYRRIVPVSEF